MKTFWKFFFMQVIAYALYDADARWIAQGNIPLGVWFAGVYSLTSFFVIRRVGTATEKAAILGYVAGSTAGTYLGIIASKFVTGV